MTCLKLTYINVGVPFLLMVRGLEVEAVVRDLAGDIIANP